MTGILSRFKRSASHSSSHSSLGDHPSQEHHDHHHHGHHNHNHHHNHHNHHDSHSPVGPPHANTHGPVLDPPVTLSPNTPSATRSTDIDSPAHDMSAPRQPFVTPDGRRKPSPIKLPDLVATQPALGTPKLVITKEGSDSPHSFNDSHGASPPSTSLTARGSRPHRSSLSPSDSVILNSDREQTDGDHDTTPINPSFRPDGTAASNTMATPPLPASASLNHSLNLSPEPPRKRADSTVSSNHTRTTRSGSIVGKITGRPVSPSNLSVNHSDSRRSSLHITRPKKGKRGHRKERARSISSIASGQGPMAAALARSGISTASHADAEQSQATASGQRKVSNNRSPFLVRGKDGGDDDLGRGHGEDDQSKLDYDGYDEDDEDDSDSYFDDDLPVTGFAVASNRRQSDFHSLFTAVDDGDYLIEDYGCALSKDILVQGRLYISENHLCFYANIFGWVTALVIPFTEIKTIEKKMTAIVIPNAIQVSTNDAKYTFASLISRGATYDVMMNVWRLCNPDAVMSFTSLGNGSSRPASINGDDKEVAAVGGSAGGEGGTRKGHAKTECDCSKSGKHYAEVALNTTFHATPEKVYNLMFNSEWFKTFLSEDEKLRDIEMSDWRPAPETKKISRTTSYIKPLNGSIGPKQTKCHITDEHDHCDYDNYISMLTTTTTPDVPSGGVFSVKTRTCITWAGANSSKVLVTTAVEWTGKSWVKGIIEKSAIDGQKQYHEDLEAGMKGYMKEYPEEFAGAPGVDEEKEDEENGDGSKADGNASAAPTEAAAYAAQKRKERQEADYWSMQGGLDNLYTGAKYFASGISELVTSLSNLVADLPMSKETLFGSIVAVLVLSNLYTFFAYRRAGEAVDSRRARRLGNKAVYTNDVEEAVRAVLKERELSPLDEARELARLLDDVEARLGRLLAAKSTVTEAKRKSDLADLD